MAGDLKALEEIRRINASFPYTDPIRDWKAAGKKVVGWSCIYVPEEIIHAAGMLPIRVTGHVEESALEHASSYLYTNSCSFMRSCFDLALIGGYDFLDGYVSCSPCEGVLRLAEVWDHYLKNPPLIYILDVPRRISEGGFKFYREEVLELKNRLEQFFGVEISDDALRQSIRTYQETRDLFRKLYELRKSDTPPISGAETLEVLNASGRMPREKFNLLLKELLEQIESSKRSLSGDVRLMISGTVLNNSDFIKGVEELGALVVADEVCTGARYWWEAVDTNLEPLEALSRRYLNTLFPCARTNPPERRTEQILQLADDFRVDGVMALTIRNCAPYIYDLPLWKGKLEERGIAVLDLSTEYGTAISGQVKTRVEAFLEMLI